MRRPSIRPAYTTRRRRPRSQHHHWSDRLTPPQRTDELAKLKQAEAGLIHHWNAAQDARKMSRLDAKIGNILTGPDALTTFTGRAGNGVNAVTFILADGQKVSAIVQNGWYEAWWPGSAKDSGADAVTVSSPRPQERALRRCSTGRSSMSNNPRRAPPGGCSVFAPTVLKPGIAPQLSTHYAFFKNTPPSPLSAQPKFVRTFIERRGQSLGGRDRAGRGNRQRPTASRQVARRPCPDRDPRHRRALPYPTHQEQRRRRMHRHQRHDALGRIRGIRRIRPERIYLHAEWAGTQREQDRDSEFRLRQKAHRARPQQCRVRDLLDAAKSVSFKNAFGNLKRYPAG